MDYAVQTMQYMFTHVEGEHRPAEIGGLAYGDDSDTLYISKDLRHRVAHVVTDGKS